MGRRDAAARHTRACLHLKSHRCESMLQRTIMFVALRYTEFYSADLLENYKKDNDVRIVACVDRESLGKISAPIRQAVDAIHVLPSINRLDFWPVFCQDDVEAVLS